MSVDLADWTTQTADWRYSAACRGLPFDPASLLTDGPNTRGRVCLAWYRKLMNKP